MVASAVCDDMWLSAVWDDKWLSAMGEMTCGCQHCVV